MYRITIYNGGTPTIIHGERRKLANAKITRERNQICSLSFDIFPNNPGYDLLRPLSATVEVIDTRYGTLAFDGRVVMPVPSMDESGTVMRSVTCEHVEAYLLDSMQAYVEERQWESPAEFIGYVLDVHNARMPEEKRVYPGVIDFQTYDTSDGLFCGIQRESTWATLRTKLTDAFGGEMRVRRGSDGRLYLDYAEKLGTTRATPIKLGRNMKSSRREVNPNEVITRLYPFGAKKTVIETDENGNEVEVETEDRLTIASVNDGCEYIEDAVAIEEYGIIEGAREWDDVTQPNILLTKARAWLGENNKMPVTTTLTALDLSLLGIDPDEFELLDWYPCENPLIGLDETLEIVKQTVDVCNPMDSTFDMGQTAQTTSRQMASLSAVGKVVESVKSQQQTAITNLQNSVRATNASVNVMEDRVVTKVSSTVSTTVKGEVESQIADLDLKDGVGVDSVVEQYYVSTSATELIGGSWLGAYPVGASGYVWTRTVVTYTDGKEVELDPVCVTGPQGEQGIDGVSVTGTTRYYQLAAAKPSAPTANPPSGWVTAEPTYTAGSTDSLFFVDLTTFSNGTWSYSEVSQSSSYDAAKTAYDSAIAAGQSASAAQKAADDAVAKLAKKADDYTIEIYNGTGGNPKPVKFATVNYSTCNSENGVCIKISMVSGHGNGTSYAFLQDAIIRVNHNGGVEVDNSKHYGAETPTYDGATRHYGDIFWVIDTTNKVVDFYVLMGQYARVYQTPWRRMTYSSGGTVTQYTSCTVYSSGTKVWANNSDIALTSDLASLVANVDVMYAQGDSSTTAPTSGWQTTAPAWADGSYIWQKTVTTYGDDSTAESDATCITGATGAPGSNGAAGKGISSIVEQYYLSTSNTAQADGSWSATVPTWVDGKYMWTRSVITYTDGSSTTTNPVCVTGAQGATGATGATGLAMARGFNSRYEVGKSVTTELTDLNRTPVVGERVSTICAGRYYTIFKVTAVAGSSFTIESIYEYDLKGQQGATGNGVSDVDVEYYLSTSDSEATGGSWVSSVPTITEGTFLWSRSLVTYTDGATAYTTPYCVSKAMAESVTVGGRNILLGSSEYTEDSPYVLTPTSNDCYVYMGDALTADVVAGEVYTLQCETDGLWGSHNTTGNRSQECTIWLTNAPHSFHDCYGGTYGEHTGRRVWTFTARSTETVQVRFNAYGSGNPAVSFWNVAIQKGNAATQWEPPVEDMAKQEDLIDVSERVVVTEEAVNTTLPNRIESEISTVTTAYKEYADGKVETLRTERDKIISQGKDGVTINSYTDNKKDPLSVNLDTGHLHFRLEDQAIAGIEVEEDGSGYFFGSDVKVTQTLTLGNFAWTSRPNGNMGLIYIGGE